MIESLAKPLSNPEPLRVVIVGGGVSGLAAARALHKARPDVEIVLFESSASVGGNIRTERIDDFLVDTGPDAFLRTKPDALALCRELGLDSEFIRTRESGRRVFMAHGGRLEPMPGGMALAIPTRIAPLFETSLLSLPGKLRMLAEPLVPRRISAEDESIAAFFRRRLGEEGAERLASPLLGGVYAGDAHDLSIRSTFPQLVEHEARHGSLLLGLLAAERSRLEGGTGTPRLEQLYEWLRRPADVAPASPFVSFSGGMGRLIEGLVRALPAGVVRTGARVTGLSRLPNGAWRVDVDSRRIVADAVILATPARVAQGLVPDPDLSTEIAAIRTLSTATVVFGLDRSAVSHNLDGSGFIAPAREAKIMASTWISSKWDGRAPKGSALIRAFVGGARDPERVENSTDEELTKLARSELERFMGPLGAPRFSRVYRYVHASPQPVVGHGARLARIRARLGASPGLHLTGASYDGVGIPDCIRQAEAAAAAVVTELAGLRETRKSS